MFSSSVSMATLMRCQRMMRGENRGWSSHPSVRHNASAWDHSSNSCSSAEWLAPPRLATVTSWLPVSEIIPVTFNERSHSTNQAAYHKVQGVKGGFWELVVCLLQNTATENKEADIK